MHPNYGVKVVVLNRVKSLSVDEIKDLRSLSSAKHVIALWLPWLQTEQILVHGIGLEPITKRMLGVHCISENFNEATRDQSLGVCYSVELQTKIVSKRSKCYA